MPSILSIHAQAATPIFRLLLMRCLDSVFGRQYVKIFYPSYEHWKKPPFQLLGESLTEKKNTFYRLVLINSHGLDEKKIKDFSLIIFHNI